MLILVSPTKNMKVTDVVKPVSIPVLHQESKEVLHALGSLDAQQIQDLMKVNEKIALENVKRYQDIVYDHNGSSAVFTYQGLQFQYMRIESQEQISYVQEHLRIISGLYGVVRALDSIYPYRLEMQAKLPVNGQSNIYAYWGSLIADTLWKEVSSHDVPILVNMASKEYEKAVAPYVPKEALLTLTFKVRKQGKLKVESTQAKMARGRMVHYLSVNQIQTKEGIQAFDEDGYVFMPSLSHEQEYVFVKEITE